MIESSHITLAAHRVHIEQVLIFWRRVKPQEARGAPHQLVVVGEQWNAATSSFVELVAPRWRPVLVFASLLEAAVFFEVQVIPSMHHSDDQKISSLQDLLLHKQDDGQGVVVVCQASSLSRLEIMLKKAKDLNPTLLPEQNALAAGEMLAGWERRGSQGVLLLPDHLLSSLPFLPSTVTTLVNWDLPILSKKAFSLRLTTLLAAMTRQESGLRLVLLLGPQELGRPMLSLLSWLSRAAPSDSAVLDLAATSARENLPSAPVCQGLAEQGKCGKQCCQHDHDIFGAQELNSAAPGEGGEILFDVLEVESPVTYWVKLWGDHTQRSGASTAVRIARYLNEAGNRGIEKLEVGVQVAVVHEGYACRGVVTGIEEGAHFQPAIVTLRLIDSGRAHCASAGDLHRLPPHLQSPCLPSAALRVTVAGLKPAEDEESWGSECLREVGGYLGRVAVLGRDALCRGRVIRTGKDRLFLDRCELLVQQHHVNSWVQLWETRSCLLRNKWAEPQQRGAVFDNLKCHSEFACSRSSSKPGLGRSSAGELPTHEPCQVFISELFSPHLIFVQRADLLPRLSALRERIASDFAPRLMERDERWTPEEGECVLVQKEDLGWERATVIELGGKVRLLLVDTGEQIEVKREEIFHCPSHFRVDPAFAVPCSLARVSPFPGPTWSIEAGDFLFEITRRRDVDEPSLVYCSAVNTKSGGYQVRLSLVGEVDLDLSEALVEREYAKWSLEAVTRDATFDSIETDFVSMTSQPENESRSDKMSQQEDDCENSKLGLSFENVELAHVNENFPVCLCPLLSSNRQLTSKWRWNNDGSLLLCFSLPLELMRLSEEQVHVVVTKQTVRAQVIVDDGVLFRGDHLLWGRVYPKRSSVAIVGTEVHVNLWRVAASEWPSFLTSKSVTF